MRSINKGIIFLTCIIFTALSSSANERLVLEFDEFMSIVKNEHPISKKANLFLEEGAAKKLKSQGGFDPKLQANYTDKQFKESNYYSNFGAELKIPTWYGIELKAGYENNNGVYLNPESKTPNGGLAYAGVNFSLGNGLIINQRRAELKKARIFIESSKLQQQLLLNDLYLAATKSYWEWFSAFHQLQIMKDALINAEKRFIVIQQNALIGEKSIMDTVEAKVQVNNRQIKVRSFEIKLIKAKNNLNLYLWSSGSIPLVVENNVRPENLNKSKENIPQNVSDSLLFLHPKIQLMEQEIQMQGIDISLSKESLKPKVDLSYNPLYEVSNNQVGGFDVQNRKVGVNLAYPIFSRKARGNYRLNKIKQKHKIIDLSVEKEKVKQNVNSAFSEWENYANQLLLFTQLKTNYEKLSKSESLLFKAGESSFFMVNAREKAYIQSMQGLVEIIQSKNEALGYYNYTICKIN